MRTCANEWDNIILDSALWEFNLEVEKANAARDAKLRLRREGTKPVDLLLSVIFLFSELLEFDRFCSFTLRGAAIGEWGKD